MLAVFIGLAACSGGTQRVLPSVSGVPPAGAERTTQGVQTWCNGCATPVQSFFTELSAYESTAGVSVPTLSGQTFSANTAGQVYGYDANYNDIEAISPAGATVVLGNPVDAPSALLWSYDHLFVFGTQGFIGTPTLVELETDGALDATIPIPNAPISLTGGMAVDGLHRVAYLLGHDYRTNGNVMGIADFATSSVNTVVLKGSGDPGSGQNPFYVSGLVFYRSVDRSGNQYVERFSTTARASLPSYAVPAGETLDDVAPDGSGADLLTEKPAGGSTAFIVHHIDASGRATIWTTITLATGAYGFYESLLWPAPGRAGTAHVQIATADAPGYAGVPRFGYTVPISEPATIYTVGPAGIASTFDLHAVAAAAAAASIPSVGFLTPALINADGDVWGQNIALGAGMLEVYNLNQLVVSETPPSSPSDTANPAAITVPRGGRQQIYISENGGVPACAAPCAGGPFVVGYPSAGYVVGEAYDGTATYGTTKAAQYTLTGEKSGSITMEVTDRQGNSTVMPVVVP